MKKTKKTNKPAQSPRRKTPCKPVKVAARTSDRWIFQHQIEQIVTYLSWAVEWVTDETRDPLRIYNLGGAETIGHLLSCWLVQVGGMEECETSDGRKILFDDNLLPRETEAVHKRIASVLKDAGVEVVNG